ncbi:MAG: hypothetical protein IKJ97_07365 [Bacteroidaceae bacterium]|nr:hypothetical protein [Bacteroidaceae bacterium]
MIIAVDFDGTIVEHKYPEIGRERPFATSTLRKLIEEQHQLILWTVRRGKELEEAVNWCKERGVEFYAINKSYPEEVIEETEVCCKVNADLFIDDLNLGGLPNWSAIYKMISEGKKWRDIYARHQNNEDEEPKRKKRGWFW